MPVAVGGIPDMGRHLRELLAQVPPGRVTTYRGLAEALGNPIATRWVAQFLLQHEHDAACLCHRVVPGDGQLDRSAAGEWRAGARRLAAEGVEVRQGAVDLDRYGFDQFAGDRPLESLKQVQEDVLAKVSLRGRRRMPDLVGGVDVSYPREDEGVGAYALVEMAGGRLVWSVTVRRPVVFPYITSYLSFRELPIHLALLEKARAAGRLAEVLLVDGSGVLHQRHAGIASHLGVVAGVPTIGVTKKLLCGQVELEGLRPLQSRPVIHEGRMIGVAIRPSLRSRRPIFVSPGHRVSLAMAEKVVRSLLAGRRLPEPLYWADRLSRSAGR